MSRTWGGAWGGPRCSSAAFSIVEDGGISICVFEPVCTTRQFTCWELAFASAFSRSLPMPLRPIRHLHGNGNVCLWLRRKNRVVPMFVLYAACYSELAAHQKICLHARVVQRSASRNEIGAG